MNHWLTTRDRGQKIFSTSAPSSGTVTLSALKIFEGFDGSASDTASAINITTHNSTSTRREAD
jgi:gamma-glutamyltranspeptidase/glutathione hydrolase